MKFKYKPIIIKRINIIYSLGLKNALPIEASKTICEAYNDNKILGLEMFGKQAILNAHYNYFHLLANLRANELNFLNK